jgi:hypothetical protein
VVSALISCSFCNGLSGIEQTLINKLVSDMKPLTLLNPKDILQLHWQNPVPGLNPCNLHMAH